MDERIRDPLQLYSILIVFFLFYYMFSINPLFPVFSVEVIDENKRLQVDVTKLKERVKDLESETLYLSYFHHISLL